MIAKERPPALGWPVSSPDYVLGHAGLSDIDAELGSSPWIRGAPHNGLAMLISRISLRISGATVGRPPRRRDFQRQRSEPGAVPFNHGLRLHDRQGAQHLRGAKRYKPANIRRSSIPNIGRFGDCRRNTLS